MKKSLISVIIPTYNSEKFLEKCLKSIVGQSYTNTEIIIVDNYSLDKTREIAEKYGRVVLHKGPRSESRNIGFVLAQGEYILSLDSDMELNPHVLCQCLSQTRMGCDAIIIPEISIGESYWARCRALEKKCYIGNDLVEAARFFSRNIFEDINGYDASLEAGEDWDIHIRIKRAGYRIGRTEEYIKHMEGKLRLHEIFNKKFRYGKSFNRYLRKHPDIAQKQLGIFRIMNFGKCKFLTDYPPLIPGLFLMKNLEIVSYIMGRLTKRVQ